MSYLTRGPAQAGIGSKANGAGRRHDEPNTPSGARKEAA